MNKLYGQILVAISTVVMLYTNMTDATSRSIASTEGPDAAGGTMYDLYPTAVSPVPITFAVWMPIFLGLLCFAVYQLLPAQRENAQLAALRGPILAAILFNASTPFMPIGYSVLAIVGVLVSLIFAFLVVRRPDSAEDRAFRVFARLPVTLFFSWITLATIVNTSQWLVSLNWNGFGLPAEIWGAVMLLVATGIGFLIVRQYRTVAFGVVLIWGFWGIYFVNTAAMPILIAVVIGTALLVWSLIGLRKKPTDGQQVLAKAA